MKTILQIFLIGILAACHSSGELITESENPASTADNSVVQYTTIYIIHGDANYLYHDREGNARQADEEKVKEAISVAEQADKGEVFIFYQRPETKVFGIFPRKDRLLLHYRNGNLVHQQRYSPNSSDSSFVTEQQLFHRYSAGQESRTFILYFGHEIPHLRKTRYHKSRRDADFTIELFADGAESFLDPDQKFDLAVLSTCDNGTPAMASEMQSVSRYLLASPQKLHLSHIDTQSLLELESDPQKPALSVAESMAGSTFERLQTFLETAITLSIYDLNDNEALDLLTQKYTQYRDQQSNSSVEQENIDCASLSFWDASGPSKVFYRPANFGALSNREYHSGWGCQE